MKKRYAKHADKIIIATGSKPVIPVSWRNLSFFHNLAIAIAELKIKRRQIMKQKTDQVAFPSTPIVVMVVFLSTIFFANANLSFAGSDKNNSSEYERITAVEHTEAQIKALEDALMITESQKELWKSLTQVMRENAKEMDILRMDKAEKTADMNAVERTKFYKQLTEAHLGQLEKFIPPFEAFYNSMTDEQKESTDLLFDRKRHRK